MTSDRPTSRTAAPLFTNNRRPTFARALVMSLIAFSGLLGTVALLAATAA